MKAFYEQKGKAFVEAEFSFKKEKIQFKLHEFADELKHLELV